MIAFSVTGAQAPRSFLAGLNRSLVGATGALPGLWEVSPERVAELLNAARLRWADRDPARAPS
jgi:hypothetical protein